MRLNTASFLGRVLHVESTTTTLLTFFFHDHGVGSTDHFQSLQHFCTTPKEMPVSLANWRIPAPITLAEISISLRLTLSRLCTIKGFSCDQWNRPLIT